MRSLIWSVIIYIVLINLLSKWIDMLSWIPWLPIYIWIPHPLIPSHWFDVCDALPTCNYSESRINQTLNRVPKGEIFVNLTCLKWTAVYSKHTKVGPYDVLFTEVSLCIYYYSQTCLNWTPLGLNNLFSLDRCLVYTGSNYIDI